MIRVLICDDQDMVREGLKTILGGEPDITVAGVAHDGADALGMIPECRPDVVLMDLKMPVLNGVQATTAICRQYPQIRVLVLTTYDADEWVFDAVRAGASGYVLKDTPRARLIEAIKETAAGKTPVDPEVAGKLFAHVKQPSPVADTAMASLLNEREREVLRLLAKGLSNSDIAARIYLSEGTVKNYISSILEKLGVGDRTQAAILAIRHGLADLSEP
jgi:two-component system, NarL family, response regulator LiaR